MFNKSIPETTKKAFKLSGCWPVVTGIIKASGDKLVVNRFRNVNGAEVILGKPDGMNAVRVAFGSDGRVNAYGISDPTAHDPNSATLLASSTNPRYLVKTIADKDSAANSRFRDAIHRADQGWSNVLHNFVWNFYNTYRPAYNKTQVQVNSPALEHLMNVYYGTSTPLAVPEAHQTIEQANELRKKRDASVQEYYRTVEDMLYRDKWVIVYRSDKPDPEILVMGVDMRVAVEGLKLDYPETYIMSDYSESITYEPRMFVGWQGIDDSIRDSILGKLTMVKKLRERMHANGELGTTPLVFIDDMHFIEHVNRFILPLRAMTLSITGHNVVGSAAIMIDK